ncbi:hypothetical protein MP638_001531 [Amoeboaphelidium occidentale]|nr:hypothetical protein MP638_001531 [Amoeboaphelidium occidentale]
MDSSKGILKSSEKLQTTATELYSSAQKGIKWDEENLIVTSEGRGTRQKIDEPKTPFVRSSITDMPEQFQLDEERLQALGKLTSSNTHSNSGSGSVKVGFDEWATSDEEEECKKKEFEKRRAMHYRMGEALKEGKVLSDDELDSESEHESSHDMEVDSDVRTKSTMNTK